jgi:hypothetical protein
MPMSNYTADEIVQRGQALYEQTIRPTVDEAQHGGKLLVINVETGEYELDADEIAAAKRAKARFGRNAALFTMRLGAPTAYRLGGHSLPDSGVDTQAGRR